MPSFLSFGDNIDGSGHRIGAERGGGERFYFGRWYGKDVVASYTFDSVMRVPPSLMPIWRDLLRKNLVIIVFQQSARNVSFVGWMTGRMRYVF